MSQFQRFDEFFYTICNETGGIEGLFNSLFSFLLRRTDFFYESDPGDKMGFPPGRALSMVASTFQRYQQEHYKKYPAKSREEYEKKLEEYKKKEQEQKDQEEKQKKEKQQQQQEQQQKQQQKQAQQLAFNKYNGGETDKYEWSQNSSEVIVCVKLPENTTKKQLNVEFTNETLSIKVKGDKMIDGKLYDKIKIDDSMWTIEDGSKLVLTMEKASDNIWKTVIQGDQEIDATKVENSKALDEFDPETQGALRKIMYEQQRKMQGLPTTDEEKQYEMLKQAWNAEGSPFKGQPFDPSKINLPGQGQMNL